MFFEELYTLTKKKCIKEQTTKAMFLLKSRISNLNLPIDCQLKRFDQTIFYIFYFMAVRYGVLKMVLLLKVYIYVFFGEVFLVLYVAHHCI